MCTHKQPSSSRIKRFFFSSFFCPICAYPHLSPSPPSFRRRDTKIQDEEDPYFLERRRRHELVELPNGVRVRRGKGSNSNRAVRSSASEWSVSSNSRGGSQHHHHHHRPLGRAPAYVHASAAALSTSEPAPSRIHTSPSPLAGNDDEGAADAWFSPRQTLQSTTKAPDDTCPAEGPKESVVEESDYIVTQSDIGFYGRQHQQQQLLLQQQQQQQQQQWEGSDVYCSIGGSSVGYVSEQFHRQDDPISPGLLMDEEGPRPATTEEEEEPGIMTRGDFMLGTEGEMAVEERMREEPIYVSQKTQTDLSSMAVSCGAFFVAGFIFPPSISMSACKWCSSTYTSGT